MKDTKWTNEPPTKEGYYWFFGWTWATPDDLLTTKKELVFVDVRKISNGFVYICKGALIYPRSENHIGVWVKIEMPNMFGQDEIVDNLGDAFIEGYDE
ncbi:MAG: hypothetical protein ACTSQA_07985 [Candidatus Heimdallarchaeaceae archaeon]